MPQTRARTAAQSTRPASVIDRRGAQFVQIRRSGSRQDAKVAERLQTLSEPFLLAQVAFLGGAFGLAASAFSWARF
jgi:hypothetical protein